MKFKLIKMLQSDSTKKKKLGQRRAFKKSKSRNKKEKLF